MPTPVSAYKTEKKPGLGESFELYVTHVGWGRNVTHTLRLFGLPPPWRARNLVGACELRFQSGIVDVSGNLVFLGATAVVAK